MNSFILVGYLDWNFSALKLCSVGSFEGKLVGKEQNITYHVAEDENSLWGDGELQVYPWRFEHIPLFLLLLTWRDCL